LFTLNVKWQYPIAYLWGKHPINPFSTDLKEWFVIRIPHFMGKLAINP